jgi:hypothetical protein
VSDKYEHLTREHLMASLNLLDNYSPAMRDALNKLTIDWQTSTELETTTNTLEALLKRGDVERRKNTKYRRLTSNLKNRYLWRIKEGRGEAL